MKFRKIIVNRPRLYNRVTILQFNYDGEGSAIIMTENGLDTIELGHLQVILDPTFYALEDV